MRFGDELFELGPGFKQKLINFKEGVAREGVSGDSMLNRADPI